MTQIASSSSSSFIMNLSQSRRGYTVDGELVVRVFVFRLLVDDTSTLMFTHVHIHAARWFCNGPY